MTKISLRVATYNICKAIGNDRRRDPDRTLRVVAALEADMRLDLCPPALPLARFEGRGFRPSVFAHGRDGLGWHGNGILIRDGIEVMATAHTDQPGLEPRGAVMANLRFQGQGISVIGIHLALMRASRRRKLVALHAFAGQSQISARIVAGDFNEWSGLSHLAGLGPDFRVLPSPPTFHARKPVAALDRIALTDDLTLRNIRAVLMPEARCASDHLPLVADLTLKGAW